MYSEKEKAFILYWEKERNTKKSVLKRLYWSMPLATFLVVCIFINAFSGWYKRADMVIHNYTSLIIILFIAIILIVAFSVVFSAQYQWERNEQAYQELLLRKQS